MLKEITIFRILNLKALLIKQKVSIPFNFPNTTGHEILLIHEVIKNGKFSGNKDYSKSCQQFFQETFDFGPSFLTNSCSKALEIAAQLCNLTSNDEVIVPSYAYVTDASAFAKTGSKVIFADSKKTSPHIDPNSIIKKITENTKVLLIIHYGGIPCDMDAILKIAKDHNLILIEDCAQAIQLKYKNDYVGSFGDFSTFSFHETKNIHCGEGGMLVVNNKEFLKEARRIWQEGTDKHEYENGEKTAYEWVNLGSSYQPPEISAAFLFAQLQEIDSITEKRKMLWVNYYNGLSSLVKFCYPNLDITQKDFNGHVFYLELHSIQQRDSLINYLKNRGVQSSFHYIPLHTSSYWLNKNPKVKIENAEYWHDSIVRLPIYNDLSYVDQKLIIELVIQFFQEQTNDTF